MQNSVFLKTRYLKEEYDEIETIFFEYYNDFFKLVNNYTKDNSKEDIPEEEVSTEIQNTNHLNAEENKGEEPGDEPEQDSPTPDKKGDSTFLSGDFKKIYKKIMQISHPDKYPDYFSDTEKKKMLKIYTQCSSAVEEDDLYSFLECASKLYIDLPELDDKDLHKLEKKIDFLKKNIKKLKKTYVWVWGLESDEKQKEVIFDSFLKVKGYLD